jgi:hypothetical protein
MERHNRVLAGGCLVAMMGMVITASGCRSMRNDVPPGKPYSTTGGSPPPVGFNSDPHPNTSIGPYGAGGMTPGTGPAEPGTATPNSAAQFGTPPPNSSPYGMPPGNRYGSLPGTLTPAPLNQ